jgi:hypothetical protein
MTCARSRRRRGGFLSPDLLLILVGVSIGLAVVTLIALPIVLVKMPADHFTRPRRSWLADHHPAVRIVGLVLKNLLGLVLVAAGVAMLFVPGQGLLTLFVGLLLVDGPGKKRLEAAIIRRKRVLRTINRLRKKFGKEPLQAPPSRRERREPATAGAR